MFLSCVPKQRCSRQKEVEKRVGKTHLEEVIEIKNVKFNITADSYAADAAECPNFGEVCCPGRFVKPSSKEEAQGDGVGFDP